MNKTICSACNGSGYYDHHGSPACEVCSGTGLVKREPYPEPHFHPEKGYSEAKKWLIEIGEWERVSTTGFSTDGWSIIAQANVLWNKHNHH